MKIQYFWGLHKVPVFCPPPAYESESSQLLETCIIFILVHFCRTNSGFWIPDPDNVPSLNPDPSGTRNTCANNSCLSRLIDSLIRILIKNFVYFKRIRFGYFCLNMGHSFHAVLEIMIYLNISVAEPEP